MDWDRYKRECDSPEVFSRWMLMQTLELVRMHLVHQHLVHQHLVHMHLVHMHLVHMQCGADSDVLLDVCDALSAALAGQPLSRPADHTGDAQTDMFRLKLEVPQMRELLKIVRRSVASNVTTSATRERGLGGFVEAWTEYSNFLNSR